MGNKLNNYRRHIIKIAKELYYNDSVIEQLKNAKTENEMTRIMTTAREALL